MGSRSLLIALCLALTVAFVLAEGDWTTAYGQHWTFQCPENQFMWFARSAYDSTYMDRVFEFKCRKPTKKVETSGCAWTQAANTWQTGSVNMCPANKAMAGVKTIFHASVKDRQYVIYCCEIAGRVLHTCNIGDFENTYTNNMKFKVPKKAVMTGLFSSFNIPTRDRIFKFTTCKMPRKALPAKFKA